MKEYYICTLSPELKECEFRDKNMKCLMKIKGCGFRVQEESDSNVAIKSPKWYEKYYK